MFTEEFQHRVGSILQEQADALIDTQRDIASTYYRQRTGQLISSLSQRPAVSGMKIRIPYPLHIRFLDMKRTSTGKRKKGQKPIYNKYIYGFLYSGTYRRLSRGISGMVVAQFKSAVTGSDI